LIGDFFEVGFKGEVARIEEDHLCRRDIPAICFRARRNEEGIVLAPRREQWRLILAEVLLEGWV
jgi:hypothetical protein